VTAQKRAASRAKARSKTTRKSQPVARTKPDKITGKQYYESLKEEIADAERSNRTTRRNLSLTAQNLLGLCDDVIDDNVEDAAACFNGDRQAKVLAAYNRLRPLSHTLFYANLNYKTYVAEIVAKAGAELAAKIQEGRRLQVLGHHWLKMLAGMGVITQETLQSILDGTGDDDTAGDCQQLGEILDDNFGFIAQTAPNHPEPDKKLTRSDVRRMAELGTELVELIQRAGGTIPAGQTDWTDQVQAIYALLEKEYHEVRSALAHLFDYEKRPEEGALVITLWSMGAVPRRPARKSAEASPNKDDEKKEPGDDEKKEPGE
jgi:hypothetical protein